MVILKFGKEAVRNAGLIDRCIDIAAAHLDRSPIMVISAAPGITQELCDATAIAAEGDMQRATAILESIKADYAKILDELVGSGDESQPEDDQLYDDAFAAQQFQRLDSLIRGTALLRECSPRTGDAVVACARVLSSRLVFARARKREIELDFVDARELIKTDNVFGAATPDLASTKRIVQSYLDNRGRGGLITQGAIGSTSDGVTTTLGEGGADHTAALLAASVDASEIQIWTDTHGMKSSDPEIVIGAQTINKVSYAEAAELAYFGRNILHPYTLQPAISQSIPILIKNIDDPGGRFTAVVERSLETGVRAIAGKREVTLISITSSRMLNAYGFLSSFFSIFSDEKTPVDLIATSEVSVTVSVDNTANLDRINRAIKAIGEVAYERDMAIVSLVGHDLWHRATVVSDVFAALDEIPVRMITLGSSDINLSIVIPDNYFEDALRKLHLHFFGT